VSVNLAPSERSGDLGGDRSLTWNRDGVAGRRRAKARCGGPPPQEPAVATRSPTPPRRRRWGRCIELRPHVLNKVLSWFPSGAILIILKLSYSLVPSVNDLQLVDMMVNASVKDGDWLCHRRTARAAAAAANPPAASLLPPLGLPSSGH